jgi:hypothetical protein
MAKLASSAACLNPYDCTMMLITGSHDPGAIAEIPVGTTPTISYFEEFKVEP